MSELEPVRLQGRPFHVLRDENAIAPLAEDGVDLWHRDGGRLLDEQQVLALLYVYRPFRVLDNVMLPETKDAIRPTLSEEVLLLNSSDFLERGKRCWE